MPPRTINTLLLITRDRLVRADLSREGRVGGAGVREDRRPDVDDLPSLVEATLRLGSRGPGRVWLLAGDLWTQTLTLAPESLAGLRPEEINRALCFEAEPFSGISALGAEAASVALPDRDRQRAFWLTAIAAGQLEQIGYAVEQAGGRLVGISHPAGLPRPLSAAISQRDSWQRVELWPGAIVGIQGGCGARPAVIVRNTDPRPDRWEADVARWRAEQPPAAASESLHATSSVALAELASQNALSLEEPAGLERFLQAWAEQLAGPDGWLPALRMPKRPMSAGTRQVLAAALGLATLVICIVLHFAIDGRRVRLIEETARLKQPVEQLAKTRKETDALRKQQAELTKACAKLDGDLSHYQQVMRSLRGRLATMMSVLARCNTDKIVIRKIDGGEDQIVLYGVCLQPDAASALAGSLADALGPQGLQVQPPDWKSREMLAGGGPWEFALRIRESAIPAASPPATSAAGSHVRKGRSP